MENNKEQDYSLYKYYKGEKENPFVNKDKNAPIENGTNYPARWWYGEKQFQEATIKHRYFLQNMQSKLQKAIDEGYANDILTDESIDFKKRVLILYLDLWSGKWFPYSNPDIVYTRY